MLRFFRKLRQKFLEEGHFRKYFWYALGEVFLVVIGILIALQINNWNENRKSELFEIAMLKEIEMALEGDSAIVTDFFEPRILRKELAGDSLLKMSGEGIKISEEVFLELYDDLGDSFEYRFNVGPYETIKSKGLDIISNDSLSTVLSATYERTLAAYKVFIDNPIYENTELIQSLEQDFLTRKIEWHEDEWHIHIKPAVDEVLQDPSFIQVLEIENYIARNSRGRINQIKRYTADLRKAVRTELRSRGR